ncbi:MAG TPA: potassium channel family protein [Candidatus Nanoarchaeia archaeon]|nr:potassium channel family protein [Candidatus Nanoarchaeia archaeon]
MHKRGLHSFIDNITFPQILLTWFGMITLFGFIYYYTNTTVHILTYTKDAIANVGLADSIYFSFVTAATIGYGDITPIGLGKIFAIIEGMLGMLLYGIVISKLVSVKQEVILEEVYNLSFEEHLNRLRSTLYLSRSDMTKIIVKIENKDITQQELKELPNILHGLDSILNDILKLISTNNNKRYIKTIEEGHLRMIIKSTNVTAEKLLELLYTMRDHEINWKHEKLTEILQSVSKSFELLAEPYQNYPEEHIKRKARHLSNNAKDIKGFITDVTTI